MTPLSTAVLASEELRDIPISPVWIGVITLAILLGMLVALVTFGGGREHS